MGFGDPFQHWWAWIVSMVGWVAGSQKAMWDSCDRSPVTHLQLDVQNKQHGWINHQKHSGSELEWESDLASWITIFWMLNQQGFWLVVFFTRILTLTQNHDIQSNVYALPWTMVASVHEARPLARQYGTTAERGILEQTCICLYHLYIYRTILSLFVSVTQTNGEVAVTKICRKYLSL